MNTAAIDPAQLTMFDVIQARQPEDLEGSFRISERVAKSSRIYTYQLDTRKNRLIFGMLGALAPWRHDDRRQAA